MAFNTLEFAFFSIIFYAFFLIARRQVLIQNILITLGSFIFYALGDLNHLLVLITLAILNYLVIKISLRGFAKYLLVPALITNLMILIWFKIDIDQEGKFPLGISFFILQSMSYFFDLKRGVVQAPHNFWHYQSYLFFFPQLIMGPICRGSDLLTQLAATLPKPSTAMIRSGFYLITLGLLKKAVIADSFAMRLDQLFYSYDSIPEALSWVTIFIAYGWQIYFDFSGYTDLARGIAKLLGVSLPQNFNYPYAATSPRDFWQRWHMTLTSWFRDYIYLPLGGSRIGLINFLYAVIVVFTLSAMWHGFGKNYIYWGAWHAFWFLVFHFLGKRLPVFLSWPATMIIVFIGWGFFRLDSPQMLAHVLKSFDEGKILSLWDHWMTYKDLIHLISLSCLLEITSHKFRKKYRHMNSVVTDSLWAFATLVAIFFQSPLKEFIFFRF